MGLLRDRRLADPEPGGCRRGTPAAGSSASTLDTGDVKVLYAECDRHPLIGPNDLVFDAHGGMWFTDHARREGLVQHVGAIYYAQPDGSSIREVVFPSESPNGIGLSPDGTRLYAAETHTGRVYAWNVTAPGEVARTRRARPGR
jgi:gluconolactonase